MKQALLSLVLMLAIAACNSKPADSDTTAEVKPNIPSSGPALMLDSAQTDSALLSMAAELCALPLSTIDSHKDTDSLHANLQRIEPIAEHALRMVVQHSIADQLRGLDSLQMRLDEILARGSETASNVEMKSNAKMALAWLYMRQWHSYACLYAITPADAHDALERELCAVESLITHGSQFLAATGNLAFMGGTMEPLVRIEALYDLHNYINLMYEHELTNLLTLRAYKLKENKLANQLEAALHRTILAVTPDEEVLSLSSPEAREFYHGEEDRARAMLIQLTVDVKRICKLRSERLIQAELPVRRRAYLLRQTKLTLDMATNTLQTMAEMTEEQD